MPTWSLTIDVDAAPDDTWAFVGDAMSVPRWYTKYDTCEVAGTTRILRNSEGGELVESLDDRDEARRCYSYSVLSGAPVRAYHASFEVEPREGGSRVVWRVEAEPNDPSVDIEARLLPTQTAALQRMKEIVEATTGA